jgi:acetyl esterase/lipase
MVDYPLAPQTSIPDIVAHLQDTLEWIIDAVGVQKLVIGGDSAGATLALQLLQSLATLPPHLVGSLIFCPQADASMTYPNPEKVEYLSSTYDLLPISMVNIWSDLAVYGRVMKKPTNYEELMDYNLFKQRPEFSLLFRPVLKPIPSPLFVFSHEEMLGPSVASLVQRFQEEQDKIHVISPHYQPHDHVLVGASLPWGDIAKQSRRDQKRIAQFLVSVGSGRSGVSTPRKAYD